MFIALLFAATVATPQAAAIASLADQDLRVATVGYRLARGAADLCPGEHAAPGLVIQDIAQFGASDREAARAVLGLGEGPTIVAVVRDSAAARAAIVAPAMITAVNGVPITAVVGRDHYARVVQAEDLIARAPAATIRLTLKAGTTQRETEVEVEPGCASRFQIVPGGRIDAQADGTYVQITGAMATFVGTDDQALAVVVAHELAHNILHHRVSHTPSREAEYAADRLGVWLVARAGYDLDAVVPFWMRLGKATGLGIFADGTHPSWKKRLARAAVAVAEAKAQRAAGSALIPPEN